LWGSCPTGRDGRLEPMFADTESVRVMATITVVVVVLTALGFVLLLARRRQFSNDDPDEP